ncbi:MAG: 1-(5-phosphoribosyl)-5-[(5-phosphoribosylamino)methylideneamino]imidazole-4-carboxamide isomerase [Bacteroidota bacterium]|jgi:phosphoribosylformimino-5-aminoimidazole carboxamide ribotide isomerase
MEIIPAIDLINGKCVRLTEGDYSRKTEYALSPLEIAKQYQDHGIKRLHLVDLDGAKQGKVVNWQIAEQLALNTDLVIDFGGGVKTGAEVERIIDLGIEYVVVGSVAAKQPELFAEWIVRFGPNRFMLGADVRNEMIMVSGWLEKSSLSLMPFLETQIKQGISNVFCTDISKDGKLEGPAVDLYRKIKLAFPVLNLIASGGVSSMDDIHALAKAGCNGVIIGKAIYEGRISIQDLEAYINENKG